MKQKKHKIVDKGMYIQNVSFDNQFGIINGKWEILSSTNTMFDILPFFPMVKQLLTISLDQCILNESTKGN